MFTLRRTSIAAVAAASLVLAGCGGTADEAGGGRTAGGDLVFATGDAEPTCLDPHVGGNMPQKIASIHVLESLFTMTQDGEIKPWLAESGDMSDDGMTWTFELKEGVEFTDGTPFTAEAVKANIEHLQDPATESSTGYLAVEHVDSVEPVDTHTAVFHMTEPDAALMESLAQTWLAIQSPTALERSREENCESPVGTGPFIVEEWNKQHSITYSRNDDYTSPPSTAEHDGPALLDTLTIRFMPDAASRFAALQAGEVHVIDSAQPDTIAQARSGGGPINDLIGVRSGASTRLELNTGGDTFSDPLVRQAFMHASDIETGVDTLFFGTVERTTSLLASSTPHGTRHDDAFNYDPERASELLDEAGWVKGSDGVRTKDGRRLTVRIPVSTNQSIPAEQSLLEQIQSQAADVGFDVTLDPMDLASWYAAAGAWEFDAITAPYGKSSPDVLRIIFHSDSIEPAPSGYHANNIKVRNDELDARLDEANQTTDEKERAELYAQAQRIIIDGAYVMPLYDWQTRVLYRDNVHGLRLETNLSTPWFHEAWID
ncbi:ABC transporter substrate-binding protein [Flaviflexus huanghaiensis]|uniref:ABC transporter substrate-binding protein n=1 Tax=Flaviflexus huanghaiensis TaxID=1111473 RepID=UPI0015F9F29A|nr:ABC transporter substrate-binding protein [Flaviflexus huanghaiensis]